MKPPTVICHMLMGCLLCGPAILTHAQTKISFNAGANLSKVSWKESANSAAIKNTWNPGYQLGLHTTVPMRIQRHSLHVQTGLIFSTKGYRQDYEDNSGKGVLSVKPWYGEVPLNILYRIPGNIERFFIGAGGYFACGLGGRWTMKYDTWGWDNGSIEYTDISKQDSDDTKFNYGRRTDMGVNMLIGMIISPSLYLQLNGQAGIKNIAPTENKKMTREEFRNRTLSLSMGYNL